MSDYLCPNCGPISDEGDMECLHDSESLYCVLCGASEEEMTPLVSAYAHLQSELTAAKADAGCWKIAAEGAKAEIERLRGRCAELELRAVDYLKTASGLAEPRERIKARIKLEDAINHCPDPMPFILGKQAEAVEPAIRTALRNLGNADLREEDIAQFAYDYAQRLRQQAAEIERQ